MIDHSVMKLGKRAARVDRRTLRLATYTNALPPAPASVDWTTKLSNLGVMENDRLGDCTCAAIGHMIQVWTSQASNQIIPSDSVILDLYEKACGYNPADPASDQGGVELDVLNYWRKNPVAGQPLNAFCAVDVSDRSDICDAIWIFGAAYIGLGLPISAQNQDVWDVSSGDNAKPFSWGGHAVPVVAFSPSGLICVTWGALKQMTWEFFEQYCDEAYACLSLDWTNATGAPSGFDWSTLNSDLIAITEK